MAQLDSASDYESEGYKFESCQDHLKQKVHHHSDGFFVFGKIKSASYLNLGENQKSVREQWTFYFHMGETKENRR